MANLGLGGSLSHLVGSQFEKQQPGSAWHLQGDSQSGVVVIILTGEQARHDDRSPDVRLRQHVQLALSAPVGGSCAPGTKRLVPVDRPCAARWPDQRHHGKPVHSRYADGSIRGGR